jgi:hypothetical protein
MKSREDGSVAQAGFVFQPAPKALKAQAHPRLHLALGQQIDVDFETSKARLGMWGSSGAMRSSGQPLV